MKYLKKSFLESLDAFRFIRKNLNVYLFTIILDFIFLAAILFVGKYLGSLFPQDPQQIFAIFKTQANLLLFAIIYPILYYLFVVFLYSLTKLIILRKIMKQSSLKHIWKFYMLNILLFLTFLAATLIILGLLNLVLQSEFLKYVVFVLIIPYFFFVYSIINICHTLFVKNRENVIKQSFMTAFKRIKTYFLFAVWDIILIAAYLLLYNIIHLIFRFFVFSNQALLDSFGSAYLTTFHAISVVFLYMILAFNRIYFYQRIDENVLQQHKPDTV
jgi:hypothetical protein